VEEYTPGDYIEEWDIPGLFTALDQVYPVRVSEQNLRPDEIDREELTRALAEDALEIYDQREEELTPPLMRELERFLVLQIIDERWREHLYDMDYLREGIHLRGFAQRDPLVEYKNEGFALFRDLMNSIWGDFGRYIFHVQVEIEPAQAALGTSSQTRRATSLTYTGGGPEQPSALYDAAEQAGVAVAEGEGPELAALPEVETRHVTDEEKIGRNDPCFCGSGKKYKKCHGA
jgi:preprotein translocase subunit SecA